MFTLFVGKDFDTNLNAQKTVNIGHHQCFFAILWNKYLVRRCTSEINHEGITRLFIGMGTIEPNGKFEIGCLIIMTTY